MFEAVVGRWGGIFPKRNEWLLGLLFGAQKDSHGPGMEERLACFALLCFVAADT